MRLFASVASASWLLAAPLLPATASAVIPGRDAPVTVEAVCNPKPDAADILLPLPCDLALALRAVDTPGGGTYFIGKYELSRYQWNAVMAGNCAALSTGAGALPLREATPSEIRAFLARYNAWLARERRARPATFAGRTAEAGAARLPTEAEWEFATRGGLAVSEAERMRDIPPERLREYGVVSDPIPIHEPERIGMRLPNPLGLYDTVGNVKEMVAAASDSLISFRGGSFKHTPGEIDIGRHDEITAINERGAERAVSDLGLRLAFSTPGYSGDPAARAPRRPERSEAAAGEGADAASGGGEAGFAPPLVLAVSAAAFLAGGLLSGLAVWFNRRRRLGEHELDRQQELIMWQRQIDEMKAALNQTLKEAAKREKERLAAEARIGETQIALSQTLQAAAQSEEARREAVARVEAAERRAEEAAARNARITAAAEERIRAARAELEELRKQLEESERARQAAEAEAAGLREAARPSSRPDAQPAPPETRTNSVGMDFVPIPAGTFLMGSDDDSDADDDEKPRREVRIARPFLLGRHPVTQAQWQAVTGNNPSHFQAPDHPVENVSWNDAREFIRKLNAREGHNRYRLPTEAEWEYACRAGTAGRYCFGDNVGGLGSYAWYADNAGGGTRPVGQKRPNAWGLYDMHGNVREWVRDWKGDYRSGPAEAPPEASAGEFRVFRGGSWNDHAGACRAAARGGNRPGSRDWRIGFRLVLEVE